MSSGNRNYSSIMSGICDILVVGKAGNGKSSVCNTLLGEEKFSVGRGMATNTITVQYSDRPYDGKTMRVIDTPDITNCGLRTIQEREAEVAKWKNILTAPYPSLLLICVRCDVRYTAEEFAIFEEIQRLWGSNALNQAVTVVAFTFGDRQDNDIREDLRNAPKELSGILRRAKNKYMVFTNKDNANREAQAKKCFAMLQQTRQRDTSPGSSSVLGRECCHIL